MNNNFAQNNFPDIFDIKIETPKSPFSFGEVQQHTFDQRFDQKNTSSSYNDHSDNRTEDQAMNNLSFSIEDLLNKITKVRQEYEVSPGNIHDKKPIIQPSSFKISNLSVSTESNSNHSRSDRYIEKYQPDVLANRKRGSQPRMEVFSNSEKNVQIVLPEVENKRSFGASQQKNFPHTEVRRQIKNLLTSYGDSAFGKAEKTYQRNQQRKNNHNIEPMVAQQNLYFTQQGYKQIPFSNQNKVNSLFDGKVIRQVAASRIFQSPQKQNHKKQSQVKMLNPFLEITGKNDSVVESKFIQQKMAESKIVNSPFSTFSTNPLIKINGIQKSQLFAEEPKLNIRDFELGKQLGSGKFGDVYQAIHKKTNALFAIKKIFKSTILQYNMIEQFTRQLKIHYFLSHPNIVKLYTHFDDEYHIFLVMEYGQGGMLMQKLKRGEKFASVIVQQMLRAVDHLQAKKIAHRDIKPQNIVLMFGDTAKLCDFGWSRVFDSDMKKTFCGTLEYVSPEMKDQGEYSLKIDIWSLGVLTFQLICGYGPFKNEITNWKKKGGNLQQAWNWSILYPPEVSSVSESFMRNLLKQNPNQRANIRFCLGHLFIRKYNQMHYDEYEDIRFRQISGVLKDE